MRSNVYASEGLGRPGTITWKGRGHIGARCGCIPDIPAGLVCPRGCRLIEWSRLHRGGSALLDTREELTEFIQSLLVFLGSKIPRNGYQVLPFLKLLSVAVPE